MKTHGLTIKIKAKTPKNVRNCESWAIRGLFFHRKQLAVVSRCVIAQLCYAMTIFSKMRFTYR